MYKDIEAEVLSLNVIMSLSLQSITNKAYSLGDSMDLCIAQLHEKNILPIIILVFTGLHTLETNFMDVSGRWIPVEKYIANIARVRHVCSNSKWRSIFVKGKEKNDFTKRIRSFKVLV